jgi:hypothetical protein
MKRTKQPLACLRSGFPCRCHTGRWAVLAARLALLALAPLVATGALAQMEMRGSGSGPNAQAVTPAPGQRVTYKVKLSEGSAWTNLNPESWMVFEVSDGNWVSIHHSTNVVNMITGISRWWDHPIVTSKACRISIGESGKRLTGCLSGSTSGTGKALRHQLQLPAGASIHDYMFELQWQEKGELREAITSVPKGSKPTRVEPLPAR